MGGIGVQSRRTGEECVNSGGLNLPLFREGWVWSFSVDFEFFLGFEICVLNCFFLFFSAQVKTEKENSFVNYSEDMAQRFGEFLLRGIEN